MSDNPGNNSHPRDNQGGNRHRSRNRNRNNRGPRRDEGRRDNRRDDRGPRRRNERSSDIERVPGPDRKRPGPAAKPTLWQKIITLLTFGLVRPKSAGPARSPRPEPKRKEPQAPGTPQRPPREPRESRQAVSIPPADLEAVDTERLHVGNLSYEASESDLLGLFKGVGNVSSVDIVYNGRTHRSKGFGFVQMMTVADAKRAVAELHGKPFMGRPLNLGPARSRGRDEREADDEQ